MKKNQYTKAEMKDAMNRLRGVRDYLDSLQDKGRGADTDKFEEDVKSFAHDVAMLRRVLLRKRA
jgi:hypothetical protein